MSVQAIVLITDKTPRAEIAKTLKFTNDAAMKVSRRGFTGTRSAEYDLIHCRINALLDDLEKAPL